MSGKQNLTNQRTWDNYWESMRLPVEAKKNTNEIVTNEILKTFDRFLPKNPHFKILEIGGVPGRFLAYCIKNYGYQVYSLDFSKIGCQMTGENFKALGLDIKIFQFDLLAKEERPHLPLFDIVYSLGFIEHFKDLNQIISKHLELLKPGGLLIIGVPHFVEVFAFLLKTFAPHTFLDHNLKALDLEKWGEFEHKYKLQVIYKGYLGGLDLPSLFSVLREEETHFVGSTKVMHSIIMFLLRIHNRWRAGVFRVFPFLRNRKRINSKLWSAYAMGVYRKPDVIR